MRQVQLGEEKRIIEETLERLRMDCSLYQRVVKGAEDGRGKEEKQCRLEELCNANDDLETAAREKQDALNALENTPNDLLNTNEQNAALSVQNYEMRKTITELQATLDFQQAQRNCLENEMNDLKIQVNQFIETAGARLEQPE